MQLVPIADVGPGFVTNLFDGAQVEASDFLQYRIGKRAPHLHGSRAALFQRGIVQIGIGRRVQNLVREL